jgi:hypothetical protein
MAEEQHGWKLAIVGEALLDPREIVPHPKNPRLHPQLQAEAMTEVMERVGWVQRVIINEVTGYMLDGHLRVELALRRGEKVPVQYVRVEPDDEEFVLASFDPIGTAAKVERHRWDDVLGRAAAEGEALRQVLAESILERKRPRDEEGGDDEEDPEIRISPEPLERQDYLLIVFDNELDWRAACEAFDVGTVYEHPPETVRKGAQSANKGTGHVIMGSVLMAKLGKGAGS